MDGPGGYVRASLLGLTQGLSPLHDPLRLHPALHSQIADIGKDGSGLLRPLTDYPHLPLLPFSAPPFLPPMHLDPRLPFSHTAFHQLHSKLPHVPTSNTSLISSNSTTNMTSSPSLPGSAFAPLPPKVSKLDPDVSPLSCVTSSSLFPHSVLLSSALDARNAFLGGRSPPLIPGGPLSEERRDSPSPMGSHGSRESPAQGREASTPTSPGEDMRVRKHRLSGEYWCPVCKTTLRAGDFESHLGFELDKLARHIPSNHQPLPVNNGGGSLPNSPLGNPPVKMRDPGWETYQRVKSNRQVRLRTKKRRSGRSDETACPVCGDRLVPEELQCHIEGCLRRQNVAEDEEVDVEGDSPFEEYEWCGQRRVRVTPAFFRQLPQANKVSREGETDSSPEKGHTNGQTQIRSEGEAKEERRSEEERKETENEGRIMEEKERKEKEAAEAMEKELEILKKKIQTLERDGGSSAAKFQCLVCQNDYDRPAVSVICWHVFCEACWPHSLETKSECPQCSVAFNADDIRIIQL